MNWIKQSDQEPTEKDLPFLTWDGYDYEFWEDVDWFDELTEKERLMWTHWIPLQPPKEK